MPWSRRTNAKRGTAQILASTDLSKYTLRK